MTDTDQPTTGAALADAASTIPAQLADEQAIAWDALVNFDDRTSPEDYPDMALITRKELFDFMDRAAALRAPAQVEGEAIPQDIADAVTKMGAVEWGSVGPKSDAEHLEDFKGSLALTREHFETEGDQLLHGLYLAGTDIVLCHTGTSPNSAQNARALVGAWNWLLEQSKAFSRPAPTSPAKVTHEQTRAGKAQLPLVQAFARHRINAQPKPTGDVGALVERLKDAAKDRAEMERMTSGAYERPPRVHIEWQAADAITALHARVQELEAGN